MLTKLSIPEMNLEKLIDGKIKHGYLSINKFNIHYITCGQGKPLLLIHGANIGWIQWYKNIASFSKIYKVYAIDLPGSGKSTKINYGKYCFDDVFVKTVLDFINYKKLGTLNIVGHSIGGLIALKLALNMRKQINKIILVNPVGLLNYVPFNQLPLASPFIAKLLTMTVLRPNKTNMGKFLESVLKNKSAVTQDFIDIYYANITRDILTHPIMLMHSFLDGIKMKKSLVLTRNLFKIKNPVLIINGDSDPMIPISKLARVFSFLPNSKLVIYKNTGHVPPLERSTEFNKDTLKFLK